MRHLGSMFCRIKEVINAKIPFIYVHPKYIHFHLGTSYAQNFDFNVDLHSVDVDDVAPPTLKRCDANVMHHCCLFSYYRSFIYLVLMKLLVFKSL